ncbi:hypothetical protein G7K_2422-t1 [Saitoella complicata NRRL Y-17804]|uniref:Uncharacterized protein n=1 Tax=Saitoella complicata (strain BCRC 22490 / CBS 7301 / JCM 7358 / NBRC 10748 / NRRL Y-17804) TaxID=698492 RepID=A0A0E9NEG1_SAICN|nr:hypothetical protein G7K_2422-t1 [Saitoella complicata NRRL Y-17804]
MTQVKPNCETDEGDVDNTNSIALKKHKDAARRNRRKLKHRKKNPEAMNPFRSLAKYPRRYHPPIFNPIRH